VGLKDYPGALEDYRAAAGSLLAQRSQRGQLLGAGRVLLPEALCYTGVLALKLKRPPQENAWAFGALQALYPESREAKLAARFHATPAARAKVLAASPKVQSQRPWLTLGGGVLLALVVGFLLRKRRLRRTRISP